MLLRSLARSFAGDIARGRIAECGGPSMYKRGNEIGENAAPGEVARERAHG